jgi:bifunctional non-homologous end joining protein LigD
MQPMLLTSGAIPVDASRYAYEIKWDGVRALVAVERDKVRVTTRTGRDVSGSYPELAGLAGQLQGHAVLLDGEIVCFDEVGVPSFGRHQQRMHVVTPNPALVTRVPAVVCLFDLLWIDGESLVDTAWTQRRARLEALELRGPAWQTPACSIGDPAPIQAVVEAMGLEGVVAKRCDAPYRPAHRSTAWVKIKTRHRGEFVVGGFTAGEGARADRFGALAVGAYLDGRLRYVGRVGSGFDNKMLTMVAGLLEQRRSEASPFDGPVPDGPSFVRPEVVVEIRYDGWTQTGHLRAPVFVGVRTDKAAADVQLER